MNVKPPSDELAEASDEANASDEFEALLDIAGAAVASYVLMLVASGPSTVTWATCVAVYPPEATAAEEPLPAAAAAAAPTPDDEAAPRAAPEALDGLELVELTPEVMDWAKPTAGEPLFEYEKTL